MNSVAGQGEIQGTRSSPGIATSGSVGGTELAARSPVECGCTGVRALAAWSPAGETATPTPAHPEPLLLTQWAGGHLRPLPHQGPSMTKFKTKLSSLLQA